MPEGGQVNQALAHPVAQEPRQHDRWEQQPASAGGRQRRQSHRSSRELRCRRGQRGAALPDLVRAQVTRGNMNDIDHAVSLVRLVCRQESLSGCFRHVDVIVILSPTKQYMERCT